MMRALVSVAMLTALSASAVPAYGFCRATTCDPADPNPSCERDPTTGCLQSGAPLSWASSCLTISVQKDGAPGAGIDYAAAEASVRRAFSAWTSVECEDGNPSIQVELSEPVTCDLSEYSGEHRNANIVMFRERDWPYEGAEDALGLTRVRFDLEDEPGNLWDADIEVNAVSEPLSTGKPAPTEVDLDSLLTHEAGHVLGLAHTIDVSATMAEGYQPGSTALRTLGDDDIAGMCAVYPPGRAAGSSSCEARHGFSVLCAADQPEEEPPSPDPMDDDEGGSGSAGCHMGGPMGPYQPLAIGLLGLLLALRSRTFSAFRRGSRR